MGKLYLVPTPVGNLGDITLRALDLLKSADLVLAEDTRTTGMLLKHYDIKARLQSHHKFNEHQTAEAVAERLAASDETVVLVSDAGTPGISDPGFMLVRACVARDVEVQCLPGATAFVPALVSSGLPCERFAFEGFLPQKKGRATRIAALAEEPRTMIIYESPYRVAKTLRQLAEAFAPTAAAPPAAKSPNCMRNACAARWKRWRHISKPTNRAASSCSSLKEGARHRDTQ